jgi:hypothetical protein
MSDLGRGCASRSAPLAITALFLGESPPTWEVLLHARPPDSLLYHRMKESFGAASNFLPAFQAKGFFLDDLFLYSINQVEDKNERNEHRQKDVQSLAQRMADYEPSSIVALMCAIEPMVADAMREAGLGGSTTSAPTSERSKALPRVSTVGR